MGTPNVKAQVGVADIHAALDQFERLAALVEAFGGFDSLLVLAARLGHLSRAAFVPDGLTTDMEGLAALLNRSPDAARKQVKRQGTPVNKPGDSLLVRTTEFSAGRRDQLEEEDD